MIRKADKSFRLVVDLRKLNSLTRTWSFNCKSIPEIIEQIATSQSNFFTTCDLYKGFLQLKLAPDSRDLITITSPSQLRYRMQRCPMGSVVACQLFCQALHQTLENELHSSLSIYVDDLQIYSRTDEEHLNKLKAIFQAFRENGLTFSPKKCRIMYQDLKAFGYKVSAAGVEISSTKR